MKPSSHRVKAKPLSGRDQARLDREVAGLEKLSARELRALARPMTAAQKAQWSQLGFWKGLIKHINPAWPYCRMIDAQL